MVTVVVSSLWFCRASGLGVVETLEHGRGLGVEGLGRLFRPGDRGSFWFNGSSINSNRSRATTLLAHSCYFPEAHIFHLVDTEELSLPAVLVLAPLLAAQNNSSSNAWKHRVFGIHSLRLRAWKCMLLRSAFDISATGSLAVRGVEASRNA